MSVIVSGGSRGLGQSICEALLADGCSVATFSRTRTAFVDAASERHPNNFHYETVDAEDIEALRVFVARAHERFGHVDALINNAAIAIDGVLALAREEDLRRMLDINLMAALVLSKECSRLMLARRQGVILNISSIIAERGFSGLVGYAATKAGNDRNDARHGTRIGKPQHSRECDCAWLSGNRNVRCIGRRSAATNHSAYAG